MNNTRSRKNQLYSIRIEAVQKYFERDDPEIIPIATDDALTTPVRVNATNWRYHTFVEMITDFGCVTEITPAFIPC